MKAHWLGSSPEVAGAVPSTTQTPPVPPPVAPAIPPPRFSLNKEYGGLFSSLTTGLYLTFKLTSVLEKMHRGNSKHHTNPVGKSLQWKMDDPLDIANTAIDEHRKIVKKMKGVPGVKPERLAEGLSTRHCALSLVGEPIIYQHIETLVDDLHRRHISTFLGCGASS